jgi:uncharacterized protein YhhL (DUF1145 family)
MRKQLRLLPLWWFKKLRIALPFGRLSLLSIVVARIALLFIRVLSLHVHTGSISPNVCFSELKQKEKLIMCLFTLLIKFWSVHLCIQVPAFPQDVFT